MCMEHILKLRYEQVTPLAMNRLYSPRYKTSRERHWLRLYGVGGRQITTENFWNYSKRIILKSCRISLSPSHFLQQNSDMD